MVKTGTLQKQTKSGSIPVPSIPKALYLQGFCCFVLHSLHHRQHEAYKEFCKENKLKPHAERMHVAPAFTLRVAARQKITNIGTKAIHSNDMVKYSDDADYSINLAEYPENVNKCLSEAAKEVAKLGDVDGYEHLCLVDLSDGTIVHRECNDNPIHVGEDKFWKFIDGHKSGKYAFVHNHNNISSLSETDLTTSAQNMNIPIMIAVQNDSVMYIAKRSKEAIKGFIPDFRYENALQELQEMLRNGTIQPYERSMKREEIMIAELVKDFFDGKVLRTDGRK